MANWLSAPFESTQSNSLILCTIRTDVSKFRDNPRFKYRIEVDWPYTPAAAGMPSEELGHKLEAVIESLEAVLKADPIAVMTEVYTGDGVRTMVFYTLSLHIFQRKFNEALESFPKLPLTFQAEEDETWEEYTEMLKQVQRADAQADD